MVEAGRGGRLYSPFYHLPHPKPSPFPPPTTPCMQELSKWQREAEERKTASASLQEALASAQAAFEGACAGREAERARADMAAAEVALLQGFKARGRGEGERSGCLEE